MSRGNDDKDYLPDKYNQESKKSSSTSNGLFGGIAKLFGQDEQSKEKRRRQEAVNTAVDKVFQDLNFENAGLVGGLVGGLFKSVAKGVGGMVAEMAAESAGDLQAVQRGVEALLDDDPRTSNLLGEPVACGQPSSTSSSSMSINGRSQRSVMLVMPVFGSKTDALVEVAATLEASGDVSQVDISSLRMQTRDGQIMVIRGPGSDRGGPRGGPRGGGNFIDVEVL